LHHDDDHHHRRPHHSRPRPWQIQEHRLRLEGIGQFAKPLAECGPDELWRGLLDLALTELRQVRQLAVPAVRSQRRGNLSRQLAALSIPW